MQPIPCAHCGMNFMRKNLNPDAPKLCNNCDKTKVDMTKIKIMIECDRETQIEIEELCLNSGESISEYFLKLHKAYNPQKNTLTMDREELEKIYPSPQKKGKK